jgi:hypothetical protein
VLQAVKPKSDLYRDLLPAINSRMVDLLEDARLFAQSLASSVVLHEVATTASTRHQAHDYVANAPWPVLSIC